MSEPFDLEHLRAMSQDKKRHDPHCLEYGNCDCGGDIAEAADEIERLRIQRDRVWKAHANFTTATRGFDFVYAVVFGDWVNKEDAEEYAEVVHTKLRQGR